MSTETAELTDEAINIFLAKKCGCSVLPPQFVTDEYGVVRDYWRCGCELRAHASSDAHRPAALVRYTDSLDALFAPGGPVEKCREAEYAVSLYLGSFTRPPWTYEALIEIDMPSRGDDGTFEMAVSSNPARAMAEACALALGIMGCAQDIT